MVRLCERSGCQNQSDVLQKVAVCGLEFDIELCSKCQKELLAAQKKVIGNLGKYPSTLEELAKACKAPAKHKHMRKWKAK